MPTESETGPKTLLLTMKLSPGQFRIIAKAAGKLPISMWARAQLLEVARKESKKMSQPYRFNASRGGHAPGHLRDAFLEYINSWDDEPRREDTVPVGYDESPKPVSWLLGQLWNCRDILPSAARSDLKDYLDLQREPWTYAQGARAIAPYIRGDG